MVLRPTQTFYISQYPYRSFGNRDLTSAVMGAGRIRRETVFRNVPPDTWLSPMLDRVVALQTGNLQQSLPWNFRVLGVFPGKFTWIFRTSTQARRTADGENTFFHALILKISCATFLRCCAIFSDNKGSNFHFQPHGG